MPNKRDLKLNDYGLSKLAFRELLNFCLQYEEKKKMIRELHDPYYSPKVTGMPRGNKVINSVEEAAIKAERLSRDIELIEMAAEETDSSLAKELIKNVTQGIQYDYMDIPCGRRQFYAKRKQFFYLLALKKGMI